MTAVLSGEADIGFMGSEASIYVYSQNPDDYIVNFAQLTQRLGISWWPGNRRMIFSGRI